MKPSTRVLLLSCFVAFACIAGSAHAADATSAAAPGVGWTASCPPPPDTSTGQGTLKVTGACGFEYRGTADCEVEGDDYNLHLNARKAKNDADLWFHVSVEHHITPGRWKDNEVVLSIRDGKKIYRWGSEKVELTVGPKLEFITIHDAHLEPEQVLLDCSGPLSNYQCNGGRGEEPEYMKTTHTVSGTIYCVRTEKKKKR